MLKINSDNLIFCNKITPEIKSEIKKWYGKEILTYEYCENYNEIFFLHINNSLSKHKTYQTQSKKSLIKRKNQQNLLFKQCCSY